MRFKMAFETEDSSRIRRFMGTVSSVEVADPFHWPNSPWRLLQVSWDEPDLLQNVKRVSPWLVEVVSSMPLIHLSPFSPQRKKLRLPQPPDFAQTQTQTQTQYPLTFSGNPLSSFSSIQGARHARFGIPFLDLNLTTHKLQLSLFPSTLNHLDSHTYDGNGNGNGNDDDLSCLLTMGTSSLKLDKSDEKVKRPLFLLFGQPIHIDQQLSSNMDSQYPVNANHTDHGLDSGHCKVFLESEDVGSTLDLSVVKSYEQLKVTLVNLLGIETFDNSSHVMYTDSTGDVKQIGDEPFSRKWNTSLQTGEHGVDSLNHQTGPTTIFA
ncbi:hypothetical protein L1987_34679 [Smallanthus sonchifolius]|uniref:Uncharacterized protein n=1 Tax=Smallanthus sonchifolius TaxID=185202 RepID=A0ACB9HUW8_9ASTR|nr:hypothetical protein L1987_34679 [Smallanthus sonchifolius]